MTVKVGRVEIWLDCECGEEIDIPDAEFDGITYETVTCEECGLSVQVRGEVEVR